MSDKSIRKIYIVAVIPALLLCLSYPSKALARSPKAPIVDHIDKSGQHQMVLPDEIMNLLQPETDTRQNDKRVSSHRTVYRVQVYFGSRGERSRSESEKKKRAIERRFPEYQVSVKFDSPNWRVLAGIFSSSEEAQAAAVKIKRAFPASASEVHVVKDRVKVTN